MFFIHETTCISPQQTFLRDDFFKIRIPGLNEPSENKFLAVEPVYEGIPSGTLRRMGRAVRLGVGAAVPVLKQVEKIPGGLIIGTSMGGMEDCIKFLNQIIEYNEGTLTPTNFVQSTANAVAGQLGLLNKNKGYNITHVHRGFSFENAVIDADMQITENPGNSYLVGAVDEISAYNYNIERLDGWYKKEECSAKKLYTSDSPGSIAGEGSAMFIVNDNSRDAIAQFSAVHIFHTGDAEVVKDQLKQFLQTNLLEAEKPGLFLSGENGDNRFLKFYTACESVAGNDVPVARFKHMCGEYPTASGFALWLACEILKQNSVPEHMMKSAADAGNSRHILIYNNYKGIQHSFMLINRI